MSQRHIAVVCKCHCVVLFFWSPGIMDCMMFTFENGIPLMRKGVGALLWHLLLPLIGHEIYNTYKLFALYNYLTHYYVLYFIIYFGSVVLCTKNEYFIKFTRFRLSRLVIGYRVSGCSGYDAVLSFHVQRFVMLPNTWPCLFFHYKPLTMVYMQY